ncbi:MAG: hypothetical protein HYS56_05295 [Candidatus Omnitrophica bacterium]|nr:hypothetical protein [Candidatus Omnitrophota bacterium]
MILLSFFAIGRSKIETSMSMLAGASQIPRMVSSVRPSIDFQTALLKFFLSGRHLEIEKISVSWKAEWDNRFTVVLRMSEQGEIEIVDWFRFFWQDPAVGHQWAPMEIAAEVTELIHHRDSIFRNPIPSICSELMNRYDSSAILVVSHHGFEHFGYRTVAVVVPRDSKDKGVASLRINPKDIPKYQIHSLGTVTTLGFGPKVGGFFAFRQLGLPSPSGVFLEPALVNLISQGFLSDEWNFPGREAGLQKNQPSLENIIEGTISKLAEIGVVIGTDSVSVRSAPVISRPGALATQLDVTGEKELQKIVLDVIRASSPRSIPMHEYLHDGDFSIIVQRMVHGDLNENSAFGSFFTRDPDTSEDRLTGQYRVKTRGDELMTGGKTGVDITRMKQDFPQVYQELLEAKKKLDDFFGWPQEVEFVIEDGKLWFLQTRDMTFTPQGEIAYLMNEVNVGKRTMGSVALQLAALQERLSKMGRRLYRVRESAPQKELFKGASSTRGAMQGEIVINPERAKELIKKGNPAVFISTPETQGVMLQILFSHPSVGLITTYGNDVSHEAVLTRGAGIPAIIHAEGITVKEGEIHYPGGIIHEGDEIVLDGDHNAVFFPNGTVMLEEDTVVTDASLGIDIIVFKKEVTSPYLSERGEVIVDFSNLLSANLAASEAFERARTGGDPVEVFKANLRKHFLHELLIRKGNERGRDAVEINMELERYGFETAL